MADEVKISDMLEDSGKLTEIIGKIPESLAKMNESVKELYAGAKENIDAFKKSLSDIENGTNVIKNASTESVNDILKIGAAITTLKTGIGSTSAMFAELGKNAPSSLASVHSSLESLKATSPDLFTKSSKGFLENLEKIATFQQGKQGFAGLLSETGKLGNVFDDSGTKVVGLDQAFQKFTTNIEEVNGGIKIGEGLVASWAAGLMKIPHALDQVNTGGKSMSGLDAVIKLSAGSMKDQKQVLEHLTMAYEGFGKTGQGALEFVSQMYALQERLQLSDADSVQMIKSLSQEYQYLGGNLEGATSAAERFEKAFEKEGMGKPQAAAMGTSLAKNVHEMSLASEAYVSQQAGGPGGLQGAYKMEMMMKDHPEQALEMAQKALLKQMHGNIVTKEEATQSQSAANKYNEQEKYLTSGPFKEIFKDLNRDARAAYFGALRNGTAGDFMKSLDESRETKKVAESMTTRGTAMQADSTTVIDAAVAEKDKVSAALQRNASEQVKRAIGATADNRVGAAVRQHTEKNSVKDQNQARVDVDIALVKSGMDLKNVVTDIYNVMVGKKPDQGMPNRAENITPDAMPGGSASTLSKKLTPTQAKPAKGDAKNTTAPGRDDIAKKVINATKATASSSPKEIKLLISGKLEIDPITGKTTVNIQPQAITAPVDDAGTSAMPVAPKSAQ